MKKLFISTLLTIIMTCNSHSSIIGERKDLRDVLLADLVIVGEVVGTEMVTSADKKLERNHEKIKIKVIELLHGRANQEIFVTWNNLGAPASRILKRKRRYVLVLRNFNAPQSPNLKNEDKILVTPATQTFEIYKKPNSGPFIFNIQGNIARAVRLIFNGVGDPQSKADTLARYLGLIPSTPKSEFLRTSPQRNF